MTSAEMRDGEKSQKYCSRLQQANPGAAGPSMCTCANVSARRHREQSLLPFLFFFSPPPLFFFMQKLCLLALKRYVSKCIQVKLAMDKNHV